MAKKAFKKRPVKSEKIKEKTKEVKAEGFITTNSLSYIILLGIFLFSFYIRGYIPAIGYTFQRGIVGFAMDDSVFQMRLVENTIHFFPHRIFYDAFTQYPLGSQLSWGPLFDQMIAFFALFFGFITNNWNNSGMPAQSIIDTVGAFFPAIIGALIVFPVYVIGKEVMNEKAGLIAAFIITILPGQFLSRSVLGFTDHHVAEAFYTTLMMMFFIIAIKKAENITFDHWLNKDWAALKTPIAYSILAGITFGTYLLTWTFGVFFAVVFSIFIVVQYIIDHFRGKSTEYLGIVGVISYSIAMMMVLPYFDIRNGFNPAFYSLLHLIVTGGAAIVFAILSLASREMNKRGLEGIHYLLFVIAILIIIYIIILLIPPLRGYTIGESDFIFKSGGGLTIAEATPTMFLNTPASLLGDYSSITYLLAYIGIPIGEAKDYIAGNALGNFGYNFYLAYIAIFVLGYYIYKKPKAEYTLLVVWSVFVLAIMLAQNRFAYYYAVNVAVLSGFLVSEVLDIGDWKNFGSNDVIECLKKIKIQHLLSLIVVFAVIALLGADTSNSEKLMIFILIFMIVLGKYLQPDDISYKISIPFLSLILVFMILGFLPSEDSIYKILLLFSLILMIIVGWYSPSDANYKVTMLFFSLIVIIALVGFMPSKASPYRSSCGNWPLSPCEATKGGALGEGQYEWHDALTWMRYNTPDPGLDYYAIYQKPKNDTYPYPVTAYGVMSWWDYGHIITYWGHRIPNANPFQAGIGGGPQHAPGASTFLIAPTEEEANRILDELGTNGKPGARYVVSNAYMAYAILTVFADWDTSDEDYYVPIQTNQGTIPAPSMKYLNTMEAKLHIFDTDGLHNYRLVHESTPAPYYRGANTERQFKYIYNIIYSKNITIEDSGYAKIFEYVKGARITGRAPTNTTVTLTNTIKTNIGRIVQYSQTTASNGTYEFTVPYSTLGPISGDFDCSECLFSGQKGYTQFDTKPTGPYTVTAGNVSKPIDVSEMDVLAGHTVALDLMSHSAK